MRGETMNMLLVGLIIIIIIFTVVFKITSERNPPPFSNITTCPDCENGKIWNQANDSNDLELINCPYCGGTGEISIKDLLERF